MDKQRLDEIIARANYFEERKARAVQRLSEVEGNNWYFAILGLESEVETFTIIREDTATSLVRLQRVIDPPGEVELASALRKPHLFGAIGRYSHRINYELAVSRDLGSSEQAAFNLAWWIISALRVRTLAEILVPAVADHSWSTIAALTDQSCQASLLEDVPMAGVIGDRVLIGKNDWEWVRANLLSFATLLELPNFRLAVDSLTTYHMANSNRMMAATLWSGIEALFGIDQELRFRLSLLGSICKL